MISTSKIFFLSIFVIGSWQLWAQEVRSLQSFRVEKDFQSENRLKRIESFLEKNQIPRSQLTSDGRSALLVDVRNGIPVYLAGLNSEAAITTGASVVQSGVSGIKLEGEGILIGVWDEGSVKNHIEFGDRVVSKELADDRTHATHVTGTLIASGVNPSARGMAPKATVTDWYFNNDLAEMAALAKPDQSSLLLSNHSYGTVTGWTKFNNIWTWSGDPSISLDEDFRFGFYGHKAADLDELANLAPYYTIVWAAGNDRGEPGDGTRPPDCNGGSGYDCIIPESVAKNIITVGAINKIPSYSGPASVVMSNFSSWGPTDDGRIKPDLVGAGVNLFSLTADGTDTYGFSSGTSMATPNVTGSLALLQELCKKLHGGQVMRSATLKALAIHTAKEAGVLPGPDYRFGWGVLDVNEASKLLSKEDGIQTVIREEVLNEGEQYELIIMPKVDQKITATIVWNDPAAVPLADALDPTQSMLVNDLDLRLIAENGIEYYPWLLDPSSPGAQAIKGDNYRDNVERLEFAFPQAKPYRLVISHKGKLKGGQQAFSLILTYQSSQVGKVYYWIGDAGSWSDNTHWSLASGGVPAFAIPGANDVAIIDENSFDGIGLDEISLTSNHACATMKWINGKSSQLNFQGHELLINRELSIGSNFFEVTGAGTIRFNNSSAIMGNIFINKAILPDLSLAINGGAWRIRGEFEINQLTLLSGILSITQSDVKVKQLDVNSPGTKEMNWAQSRIQVKNESNINGETFSWSTLESTLRVENSSVSLNWNAVDFDGVLEITDSDVSLSGDNNIRELKILHGGRLQLANGSSQTLGKISALESAEANPVVIFSSAKSTITLIDHFLLCTDFMEVNGVDIAGSARINVGLNGTVTNSTNWLKQSCETVLFADFTSAFLCEGGFTEFVSSSQGSVVGWEWDFGDNNSVANLSAEENAFHSYRDAGVYTVVLTISDGASSHSVQKQIEIEHNVVEKNKVVVGANQLTSLEIAPQYQWFLNEKKIENATARTYDFAGNEGLYRVVTYFESCNQSSDPVLITASDDALDQLKVFPNPVNDMLTIQTKRGEYCVMIRDLFGRLVYEGVFEGSAQLPVSNLNNGLYAVSIKRTGKEDHIKLIVRH